MKIKRLVIPILLGIVVAAATAAPRQSRPAAPAAPQTRPAADQRETYPLANLLSAPTLSTQDLRELDALDRAVHEIATEHFIIRARNEKLLDMVATEAESALERLSGLFLAGDEYPHVVEIDIWATGEEFHANVKEAPAWSDGTFRFSVKDGVATRRIDLFQLDENGRFRSDMLDRLLPHELCHLVVQEFFGTAACPPAINEGLAMMAEAESHEQRLLMAGTALSGEKGIGLAELLTMKAENITDPAVFYAEAFSFTEYLHARLDAKEFRSFLRELRDGCSVPVAIERALYLPHDEEFLVEMEEAWQLHAIAEAQYLHELQMPAEAVAAESN